MKTELFGSPKTVIPQFIMPAKFKRVAEAQIIVKHQAQSNEHQWSRYGDEQEANLAV